MPPRTRRDPDLYRSYVNWIAEVGNPKWLKYQRVNINPQFSAVTDTDVMLLRRAYVDFLAQEARREAAATGRNPARAAAGVRSAAPATIPLVPYSLPKGTVDVEFLGEVRAR
jgi:hypothetical protein